MTDQQKQALQYLAALVGSYLQTLPEPVRGPVSREAQAAFNLIEQPAEEPAKP